MAAQAAILVGDSSDFQRLEDILLRWNCYWNGLTYGQRKDQSPWRTMDEMRGRDCGIHVVVTESTKQLNLIPDTPDGCKRLLVSGVERYSMNEFLSMVKNTEEDRLRYGTEVKLFGLFDRSNTRREREKRRMVDPSTVDEHRRMLGYDPIEPLELKMKQNVHGVGDFYREWQDALKKSMAQSFGISESMLGGVDYGNKMDHSIEMRLAEAFGTKDKQKTSEGISSPTVNCTVVSGMKPEQRSSGVSVNDLPTKDIECKTPASEPIKMIRRKKGEDDWEWHHRHMSWMAEKAQAEKAVNKENYINQFDLSEIVNTTRKTSTSKLLRGMGEQNLKASTGLCIQEAKGTVGEQKSKSSQPFWE